MVLKKKPSHTQYYKEATQSLALWGGGGDWYIYKELTKKLICPLYLVRMQCEGSLFEERVNPH